MAATPPKVFISYSWSTPDHEAWVMDLAKNLTESGVDVVVDKWSLREGRDKYVFMEQMVSNPEIQKVIVLSDKVYAEKADDRKGGVGTESQIISPEIYKNTEQSKFVPIILERDDKGEPHLPTFLRGRMYIDMSNAANRYENFEQLIRWIFDKPIHQRPPIGKPPTYITNPDAISLGTTARFRTALDHLKTGSRLSAASVSDYLQTLANSVTRLRILYDPSPDPQLDDTIVAQIEMFKPYRDEYVELVNAFVRYGVESEVNGLLHDFLEQLLAHVQQPVRDTIANDSLRFILLELFLYTVASLLGLRRFDGARFFMEQRYFSRSNGNLSGSMENFLILRESMEGLDRVRNHRLNLRLRSVAADLIKARATRADITFQDLMQADLILHVYSVLHLTGYAWYPYTLVYASSHGAFELFVRASTKEGFENLKRLLIIDTADQLVESFTQKSKGYRYGTPFGDLPFYPNRLMNFEDLWRP